MPDPAAHSRGANPGTATPAQHLPPRGPTLRRLAAGFGCLTAFVFCLIVLGALVRAHAAGLACPDWPLCFGEIFPRMDVRVAFEWTHRLLAGSIAVGFSVLGIGVLRRPEAPRAARRLLPVAALLLSAQIVLGALTVWSLLASWTVTAHLLTGNAFALTLLLISRSLADAAAGRHPSAPVARAARNWVLAASGGLLLQILLGGLVSSRYAGLACPEWPTCNGGLWIPTWGGNVGLHVLHRLNAYLLLALLALAALSARREPRLRGLTRLALTLGLCETAVGIANVLTGIPREVTGLHSALATALVLSLTLAVREVAQRRPGGG